MFYYCNRSDGGGDTCVCITRNGSADARAGTRRQLVAEKTLADVPRQNPITEHLHKERGNLQGPVAETIQQQWLQPISHQIIAALSLSLSFFFLKIRAEDELTLQVTNLACILASNVLSAVPLALLRAGQT